MNHVIATVRMTQEEKNECWPAGIGREPAIEVQCDCDLNGRMTVWLFNGREAKLVLDGDHGTMFEWNYPAIEKSLIAAGATSDEASALTDILAEEGWGGREFSLSLPAVEMISWLRHTRLPKFEIFVDENPVSGTLSSTFETLREAVAYAESHTDGRYTIYHGDKRIASGRGIL